MAIRFALLVAGFGLLAAVPASATEPGNLMKMTTTVHMSMPGMPAGMGPMTHTSEVCTSAQKPDPTRFMQQQKQCRVSDYKQAGETISYHVSCAGQVQMEGDAKFRLQDNGDLHGTMHVSGQSGGQAMTVDTQVDGKRIGACDYTPPEAG